MKTQYQNILESILSEREQIEEGWGKNLAAGALAAGLVLSPLMVGQADAKTKITTQEQQIDIGKLLNAIKQVESSGGVDKRDRYESGVEKQLINRYDQLKTNTKKAIDEYGYKRVATSYGSWQILASTAYDLGHTGTPEDLRKEEISKPLVEKLIRNLINSTRTNKIEDVISAYNAGLGGVGTNPNYIDKVLKYYK